MIKLKGTALLNSVIFVLSKGLALWRLAPFWPSSLGWEERFIEIEVKFLRGTNYMVTFFFLNFFPPNCKEDLRKKTLISFEK